ncbi:MAG TPA: YtxH domain-containing protein [Anaerolineales bacterium]|nr:YtxH domain-containing protein [Anaerolineales bacterium]
MNNYDKTPEYQSSNMGSVVAGLLIGAAAGAAAMLLLAPQSGKATRQQIQDKSIELRERTTGMVDDAVRQVRAGANSLVADGRRKAEALKGQGQELVAEQLDRVSAAAQASKKAVQGV